MAESEGRDTISSLRDVTSRALQDLQDKLEKNAPTDKSGGKLSAKELSDLVARQNVLLERVMESAAFLGHVVDVNGDQKDPKSKITISCYGRLLEVRPVPGLELKVGDCVSLAPNSSQIIGLTPDLSIGSICFIRRIVDENFSEVDFGGSVRRVFNGTFVGKIESEDRVILDSSGSIIVTRLDKAQTRFRLGSKPTIGWDDICGLEDAKLQLKEMVEMQFRYPELCKYYRLDKEQAKGALIYGPPGCGKTMLLEAVATAVAAVHGGGALETGFISIKGPEVLDMYVGLAEKTIRQLFEMAKKHKAKHGYPAIIAIDEADALLSKRGSGKSSDMEKTIVPAFLAEMQGIDDSSAIVFLCTNRPDVLDPAVIRDGRISRNIKIGRPDRQSCQAIFAKNFSKYPLVEEVEKLAAYTADEFYSDDYSIYEIARSNNRQTKFRLADLVNGAMAVGVVQKAVWNAFRRDLANGAEEDATKRSQVTEKDARMAVESTYQEKFDLPHVDEMKDFIANFKDEVLDIKKLRLGQVQKD